MFWTVQYVFASDAAKAEPNSVHARVVERFGAISGQSENVVDAHRALAILDGLENAPDVNTTVMLKTQHVIMPETVRNLPQTAEYKIEHDIDTIKMYSDTLEVFRSIQFLPAFEDDW